MADTNRVALTAEGKKTSAGSADAAFEYDAADADRAAELLKRAAADDTNARAVTDGLTTIEGGLRVRTAAPADSDKAAKK